MKRVAISIAAGATKKQETKNFTKREENKTGWKWRRGNCIGRVFCHAGYTGEPGTQNEETRNFFKHTLIQHGTYRKHVGRLDSTKTLGALRTYKGKE